METRFPRVLNAMGKLYMDRKGDYNSAVKYYKKATIIQEKVYRSIVITNEFEENDIIFSRMVKILPKH